MSHIFLLYQTGLVQCMFMIIHTPQQLNEYVIGIPANAQNSETERKTCAHVHKFARKMVSVALNCTERKLLIFCAQFKYFIWSKYDSKRAQLSANKRHHIKFALSYAQSAKQAQKRANICA